MYRKNAVVNWDPVDMTVLANEQVIDGKGWRSGAQVERRELTQWFFKISDYSEELLAAIDGLDNWPAKVKLMQANWIGKSRGIEIPFQLTAPVGDIADIACYSTRPDTMRGASFVAISSDHPVAKALEAENPDVAAFCASCRKMATNEEAMEKAEKLGFDTGLSVAHPTEPGATLPVWIGNFVLMDYGTGAVFGCPAMISAIWISPVSISCRCAMRFICPVKRLRLAMTPWCPPRPKPLSSSTISPVLGR